MSAPFDGPDLLVGEIAAIRTFGLHSDGTLWPVVISHQPWLDGDNEATCGRHPVAGAAGCKCGYWAYGSVAALRDQPAARNVAAVVSCWGRVTPGTRGLRAQLARIDAIWLSGRVRPGLAAQVAARYPHAAVYRDRALMLAEHPLTVLPSYRLPDKRPARQVAARAVSWVLLSAMLLAGLPPRSAFRGGWLAQLHTQAAQVAAYLIVVAAVSYFVSRRTGALRRQYIRMAMASIALTAWVWSPWAPLLWQVPLRAPVVVGAVRAGLSRTVRFVPIRAAPAPPS
ncbi:hypothetical protein [uncultured Jatrophihabitans sp.]|uniref:hypothetical protein n=1 Tax=uncultured Jatrophihabitans sp. TaxID=1610747 RepID=UPI0035CB6FE7